MLRKILQKGPLGIFNLLKRINNPSTLVMSIQLIYYFQIYSMKILKNEGRNFVFLVHCASLAPGRGIGI